MAAEFMERVGRRIREDREAADMSRAELARRMGGKVDGNQVGRWERGKHMPSQPALEAIARVFKRDVAHYLGPEPRAGTPDLIGQLNGDPPTQLDRIEDKLDRLILLLAERTPSGEDYQQLVAALVANTQTPAAAGRPGRVKASGS